MINCYKYILNYVLLNHWDRNLLRLNFKNISNRRKREKRKVTIIK
jgi:hypothetical protein